MLKQGEDFALFALGSMVCPGLEAIELLLKEGLSGTLINARFIKPLDVELFKKITKEHRFVFSAEEGIVEGGFGSAVAEAVDSAVTKIGLPCAFIPHGKRALMLDHYGLTAQGIAERIRLVLR